MNTLNINPVSSCSKEVLELASIKIDLEHSSFPQEEIKTSSEKTSENKSMREAEIIDYDEALRRAGGFGAYQALLFFAMPLFNIYGDQIIFNIVYLSTTYK